MHRFRATASFCALLCCVSCVKIPPQVLYRVDCGSEVPYTDKTGAVWSADRIYVDTASWGAIGGLITTREAIIPIADSIRPEIYRTERYAMDGYYFTVPNGYYTIRLHFSDMWDQTQGPGRTFDVAIHDKTVIHGLDPYADAGGFAKPVVYEITGAKAEKKHLIVRIYCDRDNLYQTINGIEILRGVHAPLQVRKIPGSAQPGLHADLAGSPSPDSCEGVLMICGAVGLNYALPQTVQLLVNTLGSGRKIRVKYYFIDQTTTAPNSFFTYWPRDSAALLDTIRSGRYATVITHPLEPVAWVAPESSATFTQMLSAAAQGRAQVWLYTYHYGQDALRAQQKSCRKLGIGLLPAGWAQSLSMEERPDLPMHTALVWVPSLYRSFLTECVIYSVLTGKPLIADRYLAFIGQLEIPKPVGEYLSGLAWRAVQEGGTGRRMFQ